MHQGVHLLVHEPAEHAPRLPREREPAAPVLSRQGQHREYALPARADVRRASLHKVLDAVHDQDLDLLVLGGDEDGLEGAQEEALEVEALELLLVDELEGELLERVHGVLRHLSEGLVNVWPY